MRLTPSNTAEWLAKVAGPIGSDGTFGGMTAEDVIHDDCFTCEICEDRFTSRHDMEETFVCEDCATDERSQLGARARYGYGA